MTTRSLASVFIHLMFLPALLAQTEGGNCDLSVRVRAGDERSIETQIQVDVLSTQGLVIATAHIVGAEAAQFHVYNGRAYRLKVSGIGIEAISTSYFEINALEMAHTETVHVQPAKLAEESAPGSPTISVIELNAPRKASSEMNRGMDAYSKGDLEKAAAHFEKAIAEYPRYARAYEMLGVIAAKGSDRAKARDFFSKSIQADNAFLPAYVDLARLNLQDQNYAESESLLAKAIAANPNMADAMSLLATAEFANKEYDKALADVERTHALPNHQQFAEVHLMAGKVLRMQNRPNAAIAQFQMFLVEKPDSPQAESARALLASLQSAQQP
ncbi:MAG TPA: tetratricopeptide repeat protein [Candidatus Acidoferrum sp.]|nr:tetratricopeptide repeat protein [Candidatus Acidoferrum sp.]